MILIIRNGFIDLGNPVYMREEKREKFIYEMKKIFGYVDVETIGVEEVTPPGPGGGTPHRWDPKELVKLFHGRSIKELVSELERSDMSVGMKLVTFVPPITKWMEENNIKIFPPTEEIIEQYMREKGML